MTARQFLERFSAMSRHSGQQGKCDRRFYGAYAEVRR